MEPSVLHIDLAVPQMVLHQILRLRRLCQNLSKSKLYTKVYNPNFVDLTFPKNVDLKFAYYTCFCRYTRFYRLTFEYFGKTDKNQPPEKIQSPERKKEAAP